MLICLEIYNNETRSSVAIFLILRDVLESKFKDLY